MVVCQNGLLMENVARLVGLVHKADHELVQILNQPMAVLHVKVNYLKQESVK